MIYCIGILFRDFSSTRPECTAFEKDNCQDAEFKQKQSNAVAFTKKLDCEYFKLYADSLIARDCNIFPEEKSFALVKQAMEKDKYKNFFKQNQQWKSKFHQWLKCACELYAEQELLATH
jgi:hypothetical protein